MNRPSYLSVLNTDIYNNTNNNINNNNNNNNSINNNSILPIIKPPQIVPIKYNIEEIVVEPDELKSYECAICFSFICCDIKKIEIYQCMQGHCLCVECWKKSLDHKKQCPQCRKPVQSFQQLARNRYLEKHLQEKILVYCPHTLININRLALGLSNNNDNSNYNNNNIICDQISSIEKLKLHLKECKYQVLLCNCGIKLLRKDLKRHQEEDCELLKTTCQYCKSSGIYKTSIKDHYDSCEMYQLISIASNKQDSGDSEDQHSKAKYLLLLEKYNQLEEKMYNNESPNIVQSSSSSSSSSSSISPLSTSLSEISIQQSNTTYSNEWSIEDFSIISKYRHKDLVKSNQFTVNNLSFQICFYPYGSAGSEGWISIFLLLANGGKNVNLTFSITIPNYLISTKKISKTLDLDYLGCSMPLGWNRLISSKTLTNKDEGFIINDKLLIKFNIRINKVTSIIKKK